MKKLLFSIAAILFAVSIYAQAPQLINYQGVARDLSGNSVAAQNISLKISVLSGSPSGTVEYTETHTVTTNNLGLFSIQIGGGTVVTGTFSSIDWGANSYYLQLEMDETGGNTYTNVGTTQLVSVPYALYAKNAGNGSRWGLNSNGLYHIDNTVYIGDSSYTPTFGTDKSLVVTTPNNSEFSFGNVANSYPFFLLRDSSRTISFGIKIVNWANGEPTLNFGSGAPEGSARHINFRTNGNDHMTILGTGNVGVGTSAPSYLFHVNGSAAKPGGGSWTAASDRRLKTNITAYSEGLTELLKIKPVTFQYNEKSGIKTDKIFVGVIAQDLQEIAPYMVGNFDLNGEKYLDVDNSAMTYMLINAVKEQNEKIEDLEAKLKKLESMIEKMAEK